jgi:hypothetical protein
MKIYGEIKSTQTELDGQPYESYYFDGGRWSPNAGNPSYEVSVGVEYRRIGDVYTEKHVGSGGGEKQISEKEWREGIEYCRRQRAGVIGRLGRLFGYVVRGDPL